jgi:leucyl aminopeptidase
MSLRVIIDDLAALSETASSRSTIDGDVVVSTLREAADLEALTANGFTDTGDVPTAIVTADARLGSVATGARRVVDVGLLPALVDDPDAEFQYCVVWAAPDRLAVASSALQAQGIIPLHRSPGGDGLTIGIAEATALRALAASGFSVAALGAPNLPDTHDLYLLRDAAPSDEHLRQFPAHGAHVLLSTGEGLFVAIPADTSVEELHFPVTRHGHNLKLLPCPALLQVDDRTAGFAPLADNLAPAQADAERVAELIAAARVKDLVARLSGAAAVGDTPIASRHVHHPDATRAVALLADEFDALELRAQRHTFVHEALVLENVFAEIAGTGDAMIWITAHLDSTAGGEVGYRPRRDRAPGADDDASGSAAVIAITEALATLARTTRPKRTIRFALFNAEEHGLVGSGHFARAAAMAGLRIDAVLQLDMIGFRSTPTDRRFEIHYGHRANPGVERRSEPLASLVAACAATLDELGDAEIYLTGPTSDDPADSRSDHSSFQRNGFPAVLISENFFGGTVQDPAAEPNNPQYHRSTDTGVDADYVTSIARATALAAWTLANA